jgi:hypothetical protein
MLIVVLASETHVGLLLDAYVHRWERISDGWTRTGWSQRVCVVVSDLALVTAVPSYPW